MSNLILDDKLDCHFSVFRDSTEYDKYDYLYKNYYFNLSTSAQVGVLYVVKDLIGKDIELPLFTYKATSCNAGVSSYLTDFCIVAKEMISMINFNLEGCWNIPEDKCIGDYFKVDLDAVEQTITYSLKCSALTKDMHRYFYNYNNIAYLNTPTILFDIFFELKRPYVPLVSKFMLVDYGSDKYKVYNSFDYNEPASDWRDLDEERKDNFYFLDPICLKKGRCSIVRYIDFKTDSDFNPNDVALDNIGLKLFSQEKKKVLVHTNTTDEVCRPAMNWNIIIRQENKPINLDMVSKDLKTFEKKVIGKLCKKLFGKVDKSYYNLFVCEGMVTLSLDYNKFKNVWKKSDDMFKSVYVNTEDEVNLPRAYFLHNRIKNSYRFI